MKQPMAGLVLVLAVGCMPATEPPATDSEVVDSTSAQSEAERFFTLEEVRDIHRRFDPTFSEWSRGGDFTRYVYLHMSEFWPQIVLRRNGPIRSLPVDPGAGIGNVTVSVEAGETTLADYVENSAVDGALVVHDGRIVFEAYPRMLPTDRHIWFSVSKTIVSTAMAILEDRGRIDVSRPIDSYLKPLAGTAWEGIPVIDILDMASGIDCPEVQYEPDSCFWAFYDAFGWPETDQVLADPMNTVAQMSRGAPSGQVFDYTSVNTEILNGLVEAVSGERFSDFVEREIWRRTGAESDAFITATAHGNSFSGGGFSSTLRDLARYGMLFTPKGRAGGNPVVSDAYLDNIREAGRPELTTEEQRRWHNEDLGDGSFHHSTRQWDVVTSDGDFFKSGFGGQGLHVSASKELVVAWFGTKTAGRMDEMPRIARQLARSGLFD